MKLSLKTLPFLLALSMTTQTHARDMVFALSPYQTEAALKSQVEQTLLLAATDLKPGETALFFDGYNARLIGTFEAPDRKGYDAPRARLQANREAVGALKRFLDTTEPVPGRVGASNWPALLRLLRKAYPAEGDTALVLLGSPIADDPRAPSVSMVGGRVPNDGHIAASAGQSPYGTAGLPGTLSGYDVYFGIIGADYAVSPAHGHAVERFWFVSVEAHEANAVFFGADLATLFRLIPEDAPDQPYAAGFVPTDKLEMLTFAPDNGSVPDLYRARPAEAPAAAPIWQSARSVTVGVTWEQDVDVDLYVRPHPEAEVVFYGNAETPAGRLYKDVTVRPGVGFETVALRGQPIDLSRMEICLNLYSGSAPSGVTGEIRIAIGDEVWAAPFRIPAKRGNKGAGAQSAVVEGVVPNEAWVLIDPLEVLGAE